MHDIRKFMNIINEGVVSEESADDMRIFKIEYGSEPVTVGFEDNYGGDTTIGLFKSIVSSFGTFEEIKSNDYPDRVISNDSVALIKDDIDLISKISDSDIRKAAAFAAFKKFS